MDDNTTLVNRLRQAGRAVPDGRIEWTPVSQRLPEKGQQIVVYRHGKSPFAGVFDPLGEQLRCLDRWSGKWWEFSLWMPVPTDCLVFTAPTAKKEG